MSFPVSLIVTARRVSSLALVAAALAGCATFSAKPESIVRERATQHWNALIAGEFDKSYEFMPPSLRAVTPVASYKNKFGGAVKWTAAEPTSVNCESQDRCVAHMKVTAKVLAFRGVPAARLPPIVNHYDETWIRENGQWWLFPTP